MLRLFFQGLLRHLPSQCAVCHSWPSQPLCQQCVETFGQPRIRCKTCALPVMEGQAHCTGCLSKPPLLDAALAAVDYTYPWSQLVQEFKFKERIGWANSISSLMRNTPWVEPALENADLIIPMPLSVERLNERGFNQVLELAKTLCGDTPQKINTLLLHRTQHTAPLSTMDRKQRQQSVQHAYSINHQHLHLLKGKKVVLLDDVMTTGASLQSAAKVLLDAGAAHITALVFARTPQ